MMASSNTYGDGKSDDMENRDSRQITEPENEKSEETKITSSEELKAENDRLKETNRRLRNQLEKKNEKKREDALSKTFESRNNSSASDSAKTYQPSTSSQPPMVTQATGAEGCAVRSDNQIHDRDISSENLSPATLTNIINIPMTDYTQLLHTCIKDQLVSSDLKKIKTWANREFGADHSLDINGLLRYLDLNKLEELFMEIERVDLAYLIYSFLLGDYDPLHELVNQKGSPKPKTMTVTQTEQDRTNQEKLSQSVPDTVNKGSADLSPGSSQDNSSGDMTSNEKKLLTLRKQGSQTNSGHSHDSDDDSDDDDDEQWLCNHYKRRCHVKFACCDKFWPCHRCHNNESNCGQKKLKSIDSKFVKCSKCGNEQEFSERSQFCGNCHIKFAKYFCPTCKHLTGKDDKPYHCEKCGICRIRSFHCDVCGVCLDVQLRDNHKCRAGSGHDECCICLEDAFTGCQILPCSHRVHEECAIQNIRRGITVCPTCGGRFCPMQEESQVHPPRKHHGEK